MTGCVNENHAVCEGQMVNLVLFLLTLIFFYGFNLFQVKYAQADLHNKTEICQFCIILLTTRALFNNNCTPEMLTTYATSAKHHISHSFHTLL